MIALWLMVIQLPEMEVAVCTGTECEDKRRTKGLQRVDQSCVTTILDFNQAPISLLVGSPNSHLSNKTQVTR